MKIALAQMRVFAGQPTKNFQCMQTYIEQAKQDKADLIVFPELCISGYCLKDKWLDDDWCSYIISFNEKIRELSGDIGIIWGNLFYNPSSTLKNRDGRHARMNACYFAYNKQYMKQEYTNKEVYFKHLTPDYRFFDDSRYFLSGIEVAHHEKVAIDTYIKPFIWQYQNQTYRIGLQVCEDLWSSSYALNSSMLYHQQSVDFIVNCSCSPWTKQKEEMRRNVIHDVMRTPFVYVNAVGMQNTGKNILLFDGDSALYDASGSCYAGCNDSFEPELKMVEMGAKDSRQASNHKLLKALLKGIEYFDEEVFSKRVKWIVGLSGGLDSSVTATLLTLSLGSERVIGYNMATQYNSNQTINNANVMANSLGIPCHNGNIENVVNATIQTYQQYGYTDTYSDLVYENIQARVRGHMLSTFASIEQGVIVNNGNKIEVALGYCTLYGDAIGALSVIGDLTKKDLFELSNEINAFQGKEIIPVNLLPEFKDGKLLFGFAPSAELKHAQTDPMKWYYHDILLERLRSVLSMSVESFMEQYLCHTLDDELLGWIKYYGLDNPELFIKDLEWFLSTIQKNVFKRIQLPPNIVVSNSAFGDDFRESQFIYEKTELYEKLKNEILKMNV